MKLEALQSSSYGMQATNLPATLLFAPSLNFFVFLVDPWLEQYCDTTRGLRSKMFTRQSGVKERILRDVFREGRSIILLGVAQRVGSCVAGLVDMLTNFTRIHFALLSTIVLWTGMSKEVFVEFMGRRVALVDPAEELRQLFKAFDRGCRGFITRDDLRQV